MEVRRLFYEDCTRREFTACVLGCEETPKGWLVTLDQTAFYPEGGGQACDLGTLGGANVLDVRERGSQITHLCDRPLTVGSPVTGNLCWERRFSLMQQHSGEHILSGIICRRYGYHNVGFHMGAYAMEIDFDGTVPQEDIAAIEKEANEAIWQDLAVKCWFPTREELPNVSYRTKKALPWPVRIVDIPGYDSCACCGVHVARTGQIGLIKILSCVKFHQGVRMELVCGKQALELMCAVFEQNRLVSQAFSAKPLETGDAAKRVNESLTAEKYRSAGLEKRVFDGIADSYVNHNNVLHFEQGLSSAGVRELADKIADRCTGWAAVLSGSDEAGYSVCIVSRTQDVKKLGSEAAAALNGRGGGKPGFYQGSFKAPKDAILSHFRAYL